MTAGSFMVSQERENYPGTTITLEGSLPMFSGNRMANVAQDPGQQAYISSLPTKNPIEPLL